MYKRFISQHLDKITPKFPVLTLIGPRQSGKSTLARLHFPKHAYVSLEDADHSQQAKEDPRGFFASFGTKVIIDEVQRVPEILSYVQTQVDQPKSKHHFVLTGSHQLLLMERITQTLAGRTAIAKLLPFSKKEILQNAKNRKMDLQDFIFTGGYPRIYDKKIAAQMWLQAYYQTYVERDVRSLLKIGELDLFQRFIRLCAGRVGNLLNYSSLANDCGLSQPTAKSWLSILQTSFVCFTLNPHFKNFSKRLIRSPKLYFYDTGLLCYLLQIKNKEQLKDHPFRGAIFENWIITELMKAEYNEGAEPEFYFWRDAKGHEVDLLCDRGQYLHPIEIKSSQTFHKDFVQNINYLNDLQKKDGVKKIAGDCYYAGDENFSWQDVKIRSWQEV